MLGFLIIIFLTSTGLRGNSDPITQNIIYSIHSFLTNSNVSVFSPIPFYFFLLETSSHFKDECITELKLKTINRPAEFNLFGISPTMGNNFLPSISKRNESTSSFVYFTESVIFEGDEWTIGENYIDPSIKIYFEIIQPFTSAAKTKLSKDVVQSRLKEKSYQLLEIESDHTIGSNTIDVFVSYSVLFYSLNSWKKKEAKPLDNKNATKISAFFPNRTFHSSPINVVLGSTKQSNVYFAKINKGDNINRKIWLAFTFFDLEEDTVPMLDYLNALKGIINNKAKGIIHSLNRTTVDSKYYLPTGYIKNIINFRPYFNSILDNGSGEMKACFDDTKYEVFTSNGQKMNANNVVLGQIFGENILKIEEKGIYMTSLFGESFKLTEVNNKGSFNMINQGVFLTVLIESEETDYEILFTNKIIGTKGEQYKWTEVTTAKKQLGIGLIGVLFIIVMIIISITVFNIVYRKEDSLKNAMPFGNAVNNFINMLRGKRKRYVMTNYNMNETNFLEH